jgi:hypothetical protein
MDYETFVRLSLRSLINTLRGYGKKTETEQRAAWERSRFEVFHVVNIQLDKKDRLKNYSDLVRFPWEAPKKEKVHQLTAEQFNKLIG